MNNLILIVSPSSLASLDQCTWLWCDDRGRLLASGLGGPRNWPATAGCHLLLGGPEIACQQVVLPRIERARTPEVIAGALEENLLEAPEQLSFACWGEADAAGRYRVALLRRSLLADLVARLRAAGREVLSAWPLGALLPPGQLWEVAGESTWALSDGGFMGFAEHDVLPQAMPEHFVRPQTEAGQGLRDILAATHRPFGERPGWLYGALAPRTSARPWLEALRPAGRLAAVFLFLITLTLLVQWGWLGWQAAQQRAQIAADFREIAPAEPMLDPLRQAERKVAQLRRLAGQGGAEDLLSLLSAWGDFSGGRDGSIRELRYASGRLTVIGVFSAEQLATVEARFKQGGWSFRALADTADGSRQFVVGVGGGE